MKVFVGMSGGVDSSVSAALLKEAGHDVTGVFIKTWHPDFLECTWREDRQDAMRVAADLGIPFLTCDLEEVYKREVADYMIREYAAGRTPNPDVMCNQHVKFGAFFAWARAQGAEKIATGHYARIKEMRHASNERREGVSSPATRNPQPVTHQLLIGVDETKDQSYFLWTLSQDVLAHVLFPVGSMKKTEVREHALRLGLSVAQKKDSQGVCFLGHVDMKEFLKRFITVTPGAVLDERGHQIGTHEGALLYTLGERRGFTITEKTPHDAPRYVIAKDMDANTITVSDSPHDARIGQANMIMLTDTNWTTGSSPDMSEQLTCRFRYRQPLLPCAIEVHTTSTKVHFSSPATFATPGQSLVVYRGEECLGGGIVDSVE
ncbi:MAG: tRNA 2-thiouridine(34) synthase MnmA [Candidatus Pacebacteria bacterium]|nr:tRNA 2-thiouridine(34) synthase MnmA [Candidatus Paceibacterota bacterium]